MKLVVVFVAALALAGGANASDLRTVVLQPVEDVSLPFWCDWGYDWDERCDRADGVRLAGGGGEPDKVWRSALRFSTAPIPAGATVVDGQEDYGTSGPLFPSSSSANALLRSRLTVWYVPA